MRVADLLNIAVSPIKVVRRVPGTKLPAEYEDLYKGSEFRIPKELLSLEVKSVEAGEHCLIIQVF